MTGEYTSYAITNNGDVYAAGSNTYGQIGNGTRTNQVSFTKIIGLSNIQDIVTRNNTVYALTESGDVYSWGKGDDNQLGTNVYTQAQTTPALITGLSNMYVDEIITNGSTTFAICNDRQELYSWGDSWSGQAGNGYEDARVPKRVQLISDLDEQIDHLVIERITTFALMSDNTLYGWGENSANQLGQGGTFDKRYPIVIPNIPKVQQIVFNGYTGFALGVDKNVYAWGSNPYGEAGIGATGRIRYAEKLNISNIDQIYNGGTSMYAKDTEGTVYSWGKNSKGELGRGNESLNLLPAVMSSNMTDVVRRNNTVYAKGSDNKIYGWGENVFGQLGNGTTINEYSPIIISNGSFTTTQGTGNVEGTIPIIGTINALTLSVTHPANISYIIDPNVENGFYCPNINIQNNSKVPVNVHIESFKASSEGSLTLQDVMPDDYDWDKLNRQESQSLIALGIQYTDKNEWYSKQEQFNNPIYAVEIENDYLGSLARAADAGLKLSGYHGLAFQGSYSAKHEMVFIFTLQ